MSSELRRYEDLYDRQTVKECLSIERFMDRSLSDISSADPKKAVKTMATESARRISIYYTAGERAKRRSEQIREWLDQDRRKQERIDAAVPQDNLLCLQCEATLKFDLKTDWSTDGQERVLLFYSCPNKCLPKRAFFDNGEEYHSKPVLCQRCKGSTKLTSKRKGSVITSIWTCDVCGHKDVDEYDTNKPVVSEPPIDEKLRHKYCFDAVRTQEYLEGIQNLKSLKGLMDRIESAKEDTKTNDRIKKLRKLRVAGVQECITKPLEAIGMTNIELGNPRNDRGMYVDFTMMDTDQERDDRAVERLVRSTLIDALYDTNWRVVKTSVSCILGAVAGTLRGYTSDEDIRKVIERENIANKKRTNKAKTT